MRMLFGVLLLSSSSLAAPDAADCPSVGHAAYVRTGREVTAAIANQSITHIFIATPNLELSDADFVGVDMPVPILRTVTVSGSPALPYWPLVSLGQTRGAVTIRGGCSLVLEHLVFTTAPGVSSVLSATPGLDLVLARAEDADGALDGPPGLVAIREMAWTFWLCLPPEAMLSMADRYARPAELPGYQQLRMLDAASQAACSNPDSHGGSGSADVPALERCWALRTEYTDVAVAAMVFDAAAGQDVPSGYNLLAQNATSLCEQQMPRDCLQQYGVLGCYARLVAALPDADSGGGSPSAMPAGLAAAAPPQGRLPAWEQLPSPPAAAAALAGGGGRRASGGGLGLILGTTIGFGALLLLLLGIVLLRRRHASGTRRSHVSSRVSSHSDSCEGNHPSNQQAAKTTVGSASTAEIALDLRPCGDKDKSVGMQRLCAGAPSVGASTCSPAQMSRALSPECSPDGSSSPITPLTPPREDFHLVGQEEELTLLATTLGRGAFGRVVEGIYRGQSVAVKLVGNGFHEGFGLDDLLSPDLVQEVEVLGRCVHPNVVRLLAACLAPPRPCLVLERMETSLEQLLFGRGRDAEVLPLPKVLHIATEVARGLAYLHPTIVHRDLKPANVLLRGADGPAPEVKIADFGLSRLRVTAVATEHPEAGTPSYMAPECFDVNNFHIRHHVDMYSFGCLMYAMLSGQMPWKGVHPVAIATQVTIHGRRPPLDSLPAGRCPPQLARLLRSCWEVDPLRRPAAAEAAKLLFLMLQDHQEVAGEGGVQADVAAVTRVA